jgi:hypothetical protein
MAPPGYFTLRSAAWGAGDLQAWAAQVLVGECFTP